MRLSIAHLQAGLKTAPYQCRCVILTVATREPSTKDDLGDHRIHCPAQRRFLPVVCHLSSLDRYTASLTSANSSILLDMIMSFFAFSVSVCASRCSLLARNVVPVPSSQVRYEGMNGPSSLVVRGPSLTRTSIEPDQLLTPFVAIFYSSPGRKVLGFRH
jgi:hypothetical protein